MKNCIKCGKTKAISEFYKQRNECKKCKNLYTKSLRTRSGTGLREYNLWVKYKMTLVDYDKMLQQQNGVCAICKQKDNGHWGILAVDHCHKQGHVRGLLCAKCNKGLGQFDDNSSLLVEALKYIAHSIK